jgi:rare lipoprotein A
MSSYYGHGDIFHGRTTANGEFFDAYGTVLGTKFALTAAHKGIIDAHPEGEWILVKNLRTRLAIWVWVNDAGPYYGGRILDLSYVAARKLGMAEVGVDPVIVYRLEENHRRYPVTKR